MRSLKHESLLVGVIYFLILLSIAVWVRDTPFEPDTLNTIKQTINTRRAGDSTYFAQAAIEVAEHGWVSQVND